MCLTVSFKNFLNVMEGRKMRKITFYVIFLFLIVPFLTNGKVFGDTIKEKRQKQRAERKAFREGLSDEEKAKLQEKKESIAERIKNLTTEEKEHIKESSLITSAIIKDLTPDEKERLKSCYENWLDTLTNIPVEERNQLKQHLLYLVR